MKLQKIYIILFGVCFLLSCRKEEPAVPLILIQYTDSTYTQPAQDTIRLDSISSSLTGYFRIYDYGTGSEDSYEQGELKKGLKVGKWLMYMRENYLNSKTYYNDQGRKDGKYIQYSFNGKEEFHRNFKNGNLYGEQREYWHENGNLSFKYFENERGMCGEYLVLKSNGDTLYYTDLGDSGTGYIKEFTAGGLLDREGKYKDGFYQDTVKNYIYDLDGKCLYINLSDYRGDIDTAIKFLKRIPCK